jgi:uncharacterized protein YidB (DUF937 family)
MSIFDTFASALSGSGATAGKFANEAIDLLQRGAPGGLEALLERFRQHGLAEQVSSWISTGRNLPITPEDVQRVLGPAQVEELARRTGVDVKVASQELASLVPQIVDRLTPSGQVPAGSLLDQAIAALKSKVGMI